MISDKRSWWGVLKNLCNKRCVSTSIFTFLLFVFCIKQVSGSENVTIYLQWYHQFQFAGYYAALEKGYYQAEGLKVNIVEGGPGVETFKEITNATGRYGTAHAAGLLLHSATGERLVALANIFQHSPNVIIARKDRNITSPHDIANSKTVIWPGGHVELSAMLLNEGIDPKPFCQEPRDNHLEQLIEGSVDAIDGYITNEVFTIQQAGVPVNIISPINYGIDFYGDTLITSKKELLDYPDRVRKFRAASLKGWEYAMKHSDEVIDIILNKYTTNKSREHLLYEAEVTKKLIMPELVKIGHINRGRWQRMLEVLNATSIPFIEINLDHLLYNHYQKAISARNLFMLKFLAVPITIICLIALGLYYFNKKLRKEIANRIEAEKALQKNVKFSNDVFNGIQDGINVLDKELNIIQVNDTMEKWYSHALPLLGKKCFQVYHGYSKPCPNCPTIKTLEKGTPQTAELHFVNHKDNKVWMELYTFPLKDEAGNVTGVIEYVRNVTERKTAEDKIRKQRNFLENVFDSLTHPFYVIDANDYTIKMANKALDAGDLSKKITCYKFTHKKNTPCKDKNNPCPLEKIKRTKKPTTVEHTHYDNDGNPRHMEINGYPILDDKGNVTQMIEYSIDTTERKEAEKALKESELRLREITENISCVFWMEDLEGNLLYTNPAFEQIWGRTCQSFYEKPDEWIDAIHPNDKERVLNSFSKLIPEGKYSEEFRIIRPDKEIRWIHDRGFVIRNEKGEVYRIAGIAEDITGRKNADEKIRLHAQILDNMAEGVQLVRVSDGLLVYVNKQFEEMFGYKNGEIINKHVSILNAPGKITSAETAKSIIKKLKDKGFWKGEIQNIRKDKTVFWCYAVVSTFNHPEYGKVWISVHEDISERKQAEESLRISNARARRLIESNIIGVILADFNGRILEANDAFLSMVGYSRTEITSGSVLWTEMTPKKYRHLDEEAIKQIKESGRCDQFEKEFIHKNGQHVSIVLGVALMEGEENMCVAFILDNTKQKQAERALIQSEKFLSNVFDGIQDGISVLDKELNIIRVNKKMNKWYQDMLPLSGKKCFNAYHKAPEPCENCPTIRTIEKKSFQMDIVPFTYSNNQQGWRELRVFPLKDEAGDVTGAIEYVRDVTERIRMEEQIKLFRTTIDMMFDSIFMFDPDTLKFFYANSEAIKQVGYTFEELKALTPLDIKPYFDPETFREMVNSLIEGPEHSIRFETDHKHKNDTLISVEIVLQYIAPKYEKPRFNAIVRDISARKRSEGQIKASLKEKEVLLKEIHHRVKNNMQVISSLLKLQAKSLKDKNLVNILEESQNRIKAMSLIHEKLYRSENIASIHFSDYIKKLSYDLFRFYKMSVARVSLKLELSDITVDIDSVIPCGLIINELITNSLKYAFPDNKKGEVKISLQKNEDAEIKLIFNDNGIGIPKDLDYRNLDSLGLRLIFNITEHQLGGKIELDRSNGTEFRISFKEEKYTERI